ncbi:hypothetical protein ACUN24_09145 [Pedobacter sp. WC2501]|uniref:hypothetical protein n=1 Tax=Pedobacter sp. WC2501 TaxID=3461400 RepID=UPI0040459B28
MTKEINDTEIGNELQMTVKGNVMEVTVKNQPTVSARKIVMHLFSEETINAMSDYQVKKLTLK